MDDFQRVLWSDETKINCFGSDGKEYMWKRKGEPLSEREIQPTVKHGGGRIMVWGAMGWNGVGKMAEIEGIMDSDQYINILEGNMLPFMEDGLKTKIWS